MVGKAELIIGVVNDGATVASGATAISDQFITNSQGMALVSQSAQTGAVIASITSVTKLAGPYVPIISMPGNTVAGTITFLKIGMDVKEGREINAGDVYSLIGNVAGVMGTFAVLTGAGAFAIGFFAGITVGAGLVSIYQSETFSKIMEAAKDFFSNPPSANYLDYLCAPDMRIVDRNTLQVSYASMMLSCNWISETGELLPSSMLMPKPVPDPGFGGGGSAFSGAPGPSGPMIIPPPHDVANIGLSIIVNGETYDAGDQYGCCTGTSDGYV